MPPCGLLTPLDATRLGTRRVGAFTMNISVRHQWCGSAPFRELCSLGFQVVVVIPFIAGREEGGQLLGCFRWFLHGAGGVSGVVCIMQQLSCIFCFFFVCVELLSTIIALYSLLVGHSADRVLINHQSTNH